MYAAAARDLTNETNEQRRATHLQDFRAKLHARLPDRDAFLAGLRDLKYSASDTRDRPLIRYVLEKVDARLRKDAVVDYSTMTIEHVASQNPGQGEQQASLFATMGNLILVSEDLNQKLKNKSFAEKKKLITQAQLPIDSVLANWGNPQITARLEALAKLLTS